MAQAELGVWARMVLGANQASTPAPAPEATADAFFQYLWGLRVGLARLCFELRHGIFGDPHRGYEQKPNTLWLEKRRAALEGPLDNRKLIERAAQRVAQAWGALQTPERRREVVALINNTYTEKQGEIFWQGLSFRSEVIERQRAESAKKWGS